MSPHKRPFLLLVLSGVWMVLSDDYSVSGFFMGLIVSAVVLVIFPAPVIPLARVRFGAAGGFLRWLWNAVRLTLYFFWQVVLANIQVTRFVLRRQLNLQPGILRMDLKGRSPGQVALLSAMITLTPGTIVMDMAEEGDAIYIHAIDASDPDEALRVPYRFEAMILEVIP